MQLPTCFCSMANDSHNCFTKELEIRLATYQWMMTISKDVTMMQCDHLLIVTIYQCCCGDQLPCSLHPSSQYRRKFNYNQQLYSQSQAGHQDHEVIIEPSASYTSTCVSPKQWPFHTNCWQITMINSYHHYLCHIASCWFRWEHIMIHLCLIRQLFQDSSLIKGKQIHLVLVLNGFIFGCYQYY